MVAENITIEFKFPWAMMPLESSGEWIDLLKSALPKSDPLFGKDIFVSGCHETKQLLLVDNDTDESYAIVSIEADPNTRTYRCATVQVICSSTELARRLQQDHKEALSQLTTNR
jgi:hypothetical protein